MMSLRRLTPSLALAAVLALGSPAYAQQDEPSVLDEIVVVARRSGAPMWEIKRGDSTVILVGAIMAVPEATPWRPNALESAAARADRILFSQAVNVSPADIFRIIWRARTVGRMPEGRTSADYLSPELQARLELLEVEYGQDYSSNSFLITSSDLLNDRLRFQRGTGDDAGDVVRRAARRGRIPTQPVGVLRGDDVIDNALAITPESLTPCMGAAIAAVEAGPEALAERGEAWTRLDVPLVMESPLEIALSRCWPWGNTELGPQLRGQWISAIEQALSQPGVTMGVAPLRVLAEQGGVLDDLDRRDFEIVGPRWKAEQP